jgi:hypothetical protein
VFVVFALRMEEEGYSVKKRVEKVVEGRKKVRYLLQV